MTVFSLAVFEGTAHWADLGRNLIYTIPGNIVGGALLVAAPYAWLGRPKTSTEAAAYPADVAAEPVMIPEPTPVPEPVSSSRT